MQQNTYNSPLPIYTGRVKPFLPRKKGIPVINENIMVGVDGKLFTRIKLWVYEPTLQFPSSAINFGVSNGAGSAFSQVTIADISALQSALADWEAKLLAIKPSLEAKELQVAQQLEMYQFSQQMSNNGNGQTPIMPQAFQDFPSPDFNQYPDDE